MRPSNVLVTIKEKVPADNIHSFNGTDVDIYKVLKNDTSPNSPKWQQTVELPNYYYNGADPVSGLEYGIEETMNLTSSQHGAYIYNLNEKGYKTPVCKYKLSDNTESEFDNPTSRIAVSGTHDLKELNVYNSKDPVNCKLNFDKVWDDISNQWHLRPDTIYVKLLRNYKEVFTVSSTNNIMIPGSKATGGTLTAEIRNLDNDAEYQVVRSVVDSTDPTKINWVVVNSQKSEDDYTEFSSSADTGTVTKISKVTFTLSEVNSTVTEIVKLQKKNGEDWVDVSLDKDSQKLRAIISGTAYTDEVVTSNNSGQTLGIKSDEPFTVDGSGNITLPKAKAVDGKISVLMTGLRKTDGNSAYTYKVYNGSAVVTSETRSTGDDFVDVLATVDVGENDITLVLKQSTDNSTWTNVPSITAKRFFAADSATGVVAIPVNSSGETNNPQVVFEDLSYGVNVGGTNQDNGIWYPYYYTTVECDKKGYDLNSDLTSSQTAGAADERTATDLTFKISTSAYLAEGRKHINIKVVRDGQIVKKDINDKPLRITVDGAEFYSSNSSGNTPVEGVFVIPVTPAEGRDYISCTIHDLPYAPSNGSGGWDTLYTYNVKRCRADGLDHGTQPNPPFTSDGNVTLVPSNEQPSTVSVTFKKTWSEEAHDDGIIPGSIHLKLFRIYPGGTEEPVTGHDELANISTSSLTHDVTNHTYYYTGSIPNLPAGTVTGNSGSEGIWRKYTYFLKEYYDSSCTTADEKSGSSSYEPFI